MVPNNIVLGSAVVPLREPSSRRPARAAAPGRDAERGPGAARGRDPHARPLRAAHRPRGDRHATRSSSASPPRRPPSPTARASPTRSWPRSRRSRARADRGAPRRTHSTTTTTSRRRTPPAPAGRPAGPRHAGIRVLDRAGNARRRRRRRRRAAAARARGDEDGLGDRTAAARTSSALSVTAVPPPQCGHPAQQRGRGARASSARGARARTAARAPSSRGRSGAPRPSRTRSAPAPPPSRAPRAGASAPSAGAAARGAPSRRAARAPRRAPRRCRPRRGARRRSRRRRPAVDPARRAGHGERCKRADVIGSRVSLRHARNIRRRQAGRRGRLPGAAADQHRDHREDDADHRRRRSRPRPAPARRVDDERARHLPGDHREPEPQHAERLHRGRADHDDERAAAARRRTAAGCPARRHRARRRAHDRDRHHEQGREADVTLTSEAPNGSPVARASCPFAADWSDIIMPAASASVSSSTSGARARRPRSSAVAATASSTPATRGSVIGRASPPARARRVDRQAAAGRPADERDRQQRDADLGRGDRGDQHERRAAEAAEEVPHAAAARARAAAPAPRGSARVASTTASVATRARRSC